MGQHTLGVGSIGQLGALYRIPIIIIYMFTKITSVPAVGQTVTRTLRSCVIIMELSASQILLVLCIKNIRQGSSSVICRRFSFDAVLMRAYELNAYNIYSLV